VKKEARAKQGCNVKLGRLGVKREKKPKGRLTRTHGALKITKDVWKIRAKNRIKTNKGRVANVVRTLKGARTPQNEETV